MRPRYATIDAPETLPPVIVTRFEAPAKHPRSARRLCWTARSYGWHWDAPFVRRPERHISSEEPIK